MAWGIRKLVCNTLLYLKKKKKSAYLLMGIGDTIPENKLNIPITLPYFSFEVFKKKKKL